MPTSRSYSEQISHNNEKNEMKMKRLGLLFCFLSHLFISFGSGFRFRIQISVPDFRFQIFSSSFPISNPISNLISKPISNTILNSNPIFSNMIFSNLIFWNLVFFNPIFWNPVFWNLFFRIQFFWIRFRFWQSYFIKLFDADLLCEFIRTFLHYILQK